MSDGEEDQMLILFRKEGCVINGYTDGAGQPDKAQVTRGLPEAFDEFVFGEPVNSIGTTFCLWYTPAHGWQTGVLDPDAEDSSEDLLFIFDGKPETYVEWATEYYDEDENKKPLDPAIVARIYQGETLTKAMVLGLMNDVEDWALLETDLQEIGYPYDFS
jgi:hypothetical protein